MKIVLLLCLGLFFSSCYSQTSLQIDTTNYYNYFRTHSKSGKKIITGWIDSNEAIPYILDECKKNGIEDAISNALYQLESGEIILLSIYSYKLNIGIAYISCHFFPINQSQRGKGCYKGYELVQDITTYDKNTKVNKIKTLPNNIYTLAENSYWYQFTDDKSDNSELLTKELAFKILKQDLEAIFSKVRQKPSSPKTS